MNVLAPLGKTIDSVANVSYSCSTRTNAPVYRNYALMKTADAAAGESSVSIEEGESRVDASVTVVFTIK